MDNEDIDTEVRGFDEFEVTLGDQMRGERATMGKSLLDVQRDLRIKASYISAIENCDPSQFESTGFIAGYVRSYARYLNMDPEDCFFRFCKESGFDGVHADMQPNKGAVTSASVLLKSPATATSLNDPITNPRFPLTPTRDGLLTKLSPSAVGSLAVLMLLMGGLGYGGYQVLQEVQRVQFAPVNQTPGVSTEVATLDQQSTETPQLHTATAAPSISIQTSGLDQLYRPQELEVPQLVARDGPIAALDPNSLGAFAVPEIKVADVVLEEPVLPKVVEEGPPPVDILAIKPAWVRIYLADGTELHQQILDAGQRYRVPRDVAGPLLHAGNSGSVFVMVGDKTFGPVGNRTSVARDVSLAQLDVEEKLAQVFDLYETPLSDPINIDDFKNYDNIGALDVSLQAPEPSPTASASASRQQPRQAAPAAAAARAVQPPQQPQPAAAEEEPEVEEETAPARDPIAEKILDELLQRP